MSKNDELAWLPRLPIPRGVPKGQGTRRLRTEDDGEVDDIQEQINSVEQQIEAERAEVAQIQSAIDSLAQERAGLANRINELKAEIAQLQQEESSIGDEVNQEQARKEEAESRVESLQAELERLQEELEHAKEQRTNQDDLIAENKTQEAPPEQTRTVAQKDPFNNPNIQSRDEERNENVKRGLALLG